jgi:hypothetical protein
MTSYTDQAGKKPPLTDRQIEALSEAYRAKMHGDGWILNGQSRIWRTAPNALMTLQRKNLMQVIPQYGRAKLTYSGRKFVEADLQRFGFTAIRRGE